MGKMRWMMAFLMTVLAQRTSGTNLICPNATKGSTLYFRFDAEVFYFGNQTLSNDDWKLVDDTLETANRYRSASRKSPKQIDANICHDGGIRRRLHSNDSEARVRRALQTQYSWSGSASE